MTEQAPPDGTPWDLRVGQRVVCIDDDWGASPPPCVTVILPIKENIYTISGFQSDRWKRLFVFLEGMSHGTCRCGTPFKILFPASHFRPLVIKHERLLTPAKRKLEEV